MKKLIVFALVVNAVLVAGRFWQELSAVAQGGAPPEVCKSDPTRYSIDANKDDAVDIGDAVYLLNWLFIGGPEPLRCFAEEPPLDDAQRQLLEDLQFGHQIAGTWAVGAPGEATYAVLTVGVDGTAVGNDENDFLPEGRTSRFHSEVRYTWRRLAEGERRIQSTGLYFNILEDGTRWATTRVTSDLEVSEDFTTFSGTVCETRFLADQDPLDPAAVVDEVFGPYPIFARRLPFPEEPCE